MLNLKSTHFQLLWLALLLAAGIGCGPDRTLVIYTPMVIREEMRIANPSGAGVQTDITGAAMDSDGSLYLIESTQRRIIVFDSLGLFVRSIGVGGAPEGQLQSIGSVGVYGDTVWVSDPRQAAILIYDRSGDLRGRIDNTDPLPGIDRYSLLGLLPDGSRLVGVSQSPLQAGQQGPRTVPFVVAGRDASLDTLFELPIPATFGVRVGGSPRYVMQPFDERPIIGVRRDGGAWIEVERAAGKSGPAFATITRYSRVAGPELSAKVALSPVRIPSKVADSIVTAATIDEDQAEALHDWLDIPPRMPLVASALLCDDGAIWLKEASRGVNARWLRLHPSGEVKGEVLLPREAGVLFATGDRLWVLLTGSDRVPALIRYAVQ